VIHADRHAVNVAINVLMLALLEINRLPALTATLVFTLRQRVEYIFLLVQILVSEPETNTSEEC